MRFLNNIEIGATPAFTLPLVDGSANQVLKTNGSGTLSWATVTSDGGADGNDFVSSAAFNTSTGVISLTVDNQTTVTVDIDGRFLTSETHTSQGYLKDTGDFTENVLATSSSADTLTYAQDGSATTSYRTMSDGNELSIANDVWAERGTAGGTSPKYFIHLAPLGTARSAVLATGAEVFSVKSPNATTSIALRNAHNVADDLISIDLKGDHAQSDIQLNGYKGTSSLKTFRIESVAASTTTHRLQITNYGDQQFRLAQATTDQPFMFYWGDQTSWTGAGNPHTTLGTRMDPTSIAVDGTNNPSVPNFRFLDDGDTGMYLASTGVTAFSSGGTRVMGVPTTSGSNGQVLTTNGSGTSTWTTVSGGGTSYTAGSGLDLNGTEFSVEADLRDGITHIGLDTTDYISFTNNAQIDFYVNGANRARLEADGDFHADGDVIAFSTTVSDARLKKDVETIQSASKKVSQLRGVEYTWKAGSREGEREIGLIAQEVEAVVPSIVREKKLSLVDGETYKTVDYEKLVALLIESNKEQQEIIAQLEERVVSLENI
tara:strand:+ start:2661 stop:4295 length:1635 start_codon:yes stop_codon:yes gene_type:complete